MASDGVPVGFRRHLRAVVAPGEATYLLSSQGVTAVSGQHLETLAPLLDGTRTLSAVLREAAPHVPPVAAGQLISELAQRNLIGYHRPCAADRAAQAYWELSGLDGAATATAVAAVPLTVISVGSTDPEPVRDACRACGVTVDDLNSAAAGCSLVVCDDYLDPRLRTTAAEHRATGRPWLLAKPTGPDVWVGPVFGVPGGPCWSCLAFRLRGQRRAEQPAWRALGLDGPAPGPEASLAAGRAIGLHLAALEATKWLAGTGTGDAGLVTTFDTRTLRVIRHRVDRRPQCADCGDPDLVASLVRRPVAIVSRPKEASDGNNHRALSTDQMLAAYGHLVGPVTGVVTEVKRDDRVPEGFNCYVSGQNLALMAHDLAGVRSAVRLSSGGKGTTPREAEVGALCEAVERYCGSRQGDEPTVVDSLTGLGPAAIHPNDCQLFAEAQLRDRDRWNASHGPFNQVCAPFDPQAPVEWTHVWSLTAETHRLLPTSMLYFDLPGANDHGPWADSNGNAAGSSVEDAIVQGFLELVERDAVAVWWYNRTRQREVDLDAFDEPWLARLRAMYPRMHRRLWVLDLTNDLGVPAMAAVSARTDQPAEDIAFGFGAHFDPRLALRRAVTELNQLLPPLVAVGGEATARQAGDLDALVWWGTARLANSPYLRPDPGQAPRGPADYRYRPTQDLREDVGVIERLVAAHDMELLVLDQTRPDIGMPVVKVIVPGMRHFWARFAPGRLFDVPVRMGIQDRPTAFADLNPMAFFM